MNEIGLQSLCSLYSGSLAHLRSSSLLSAMTTMMLTAPLMTMASTRLPDWKPTLSYSAAPATEPT